jgi:N6-adenosine-specific RNA methylase IME4
VPSAFNPQSFEDVLDHGLCQYIEGDVKKKTAVFCANPRALASPYCAAHHSVCLVRPASTRMSQSKKYGAILADPAWTFKVYSEKGKDRSAEKHYSTMTLRNIMDMPVADLAAPDCALFLWVTMPQLIEGINVMESWGFLYKTCAFSWMKTNSKSPGLFTGMGYWTRSNAEICLLGTRGKPKRLNKDVKQAILEPRREHSRKPDCVYERIERLVGGPFLELFSRTQRPGWDVWGNEVRKFSADS